MPLLSVIVPVYQAEKYLSRCVDSILSQQISSFELVLVDDGSTDKSGAICDEYALRYSNIKVIHKENEGQTKARKAGLTASCGKYVSFVDSDDWVDENMFSVLIEQADSVGADIVVSGYMRDFGDHVEASNNGYPSGVYKGEELRALFNHSLFYLPKMSEGIAPALWAKVFRRECALQGILARDDTIRFGEDSLCTNQILSVAKCVVVNNEHRGYHYFIWDGSITQRFYPRYFSDLAILYDELKKILQSKTGNEAVEALSYNYLNLFVGGVFQLLGSSNPSSFFQKYSSLKQLSDDFRFRESLSNIEKRRFSGMIFKTLSCLEKKHVFGLVLCFYAVGLRSRVKRLLKNRC